MASDLQKQDLYCDLPLGVLRCTCEQYPRITYTNAVMEIALAADKNASAWQNYKDGNLFFMLPLPEREKFRSDLKSIAESTIPLKVIQRYIRCDEEQILLEGWGCVEQAENGSKEYCFVYGEMLEKDDDPQWSNSLFQTLRYAYDLLFELDFARDTLECVHTSFQR